LHFAPIYLSGLESATSSSSQNSERCEWILTQFCRRSGRDQGLIDKILATI